MLLTIYVNYKTLIKQGVIVKELFPAGKPVSGKMFVGREKLLKELGSILDIGQSAVLVAPRRYGKTSLAMEILAKFKEKGYFVADVDMFDVTDKRDLAEKIIESCLKNNPVPLERYWRRLKKGGIGVLSMLKFKPAEEDLEVVLQLGQPSVDEDTVLGNALDFPDNFCGRHKRKMVIFMDEFQEANKIGGNALLKKMRSRFQRHKNVTYLFAGSQETLMTKLFQSRQHAFYRFGRLIEVGNISSDDFAPYILDSFTSVNMKTNATHARTILEATGGHPYYTQLVCQIIYIRCLTEARSELLESDVMEAVDGVVEHETPLFDEIWNELGKKKYSRNIVSLIAKSQSPYSHAGASKESIARVLSNLVRDGFVSKTGSGRTTKYDFKDAFFKRYVLSK